MILLVPARILIYCDNVDLRLDQGCASQTSNSGCAKDARLTNHLLNKVLGVPLHVFSRSMIASRTGIPAYDDWDALLQDENYRPAARESFSVSWA